MREAFGRPTDAFAVIGTFCHSNATSDIVTAMKKPVAKGDNAPDVLLHDAAGNEVRLSELWHERPLVLVFLRHFG